MNKQRSDISLLHSASAQVAGSSRGQEDTSTRPHLIEFRESEDGVKVCQSLLGLLES